MIDQAREERLKARMEEDHAEDEEKNQDDQDVWGGSDKEVRKFSPFFFFFEILSFPSSLTIHN